jgi:hypothetical protein
VSHNLVWVYKNKKAINFPFQTPTDLTQAVLAESDSTKRIKLLRDKMREGGAWGRVEREDILGGIQEMLNDSNFTLEST